MLATGRQNCSTSMISAILFLCILIAHQFLPVQSYPQIHHGQDQDQLESSRSDVLQQLLAKYLTTSDDSSSDDNDLQSIIKPTVQRRFCCMSPLSGKKRFFRPHLRRRQIYNDLYQ